MRFTKLNSISICGSLGLLAVTSYILGALLELPVPNGISLLIFFGFPAFGIAQWYILHMIFSANGRSALSDPALIFAAAGFVLLTAMVWAQMAARVGIADLQSQASNEAERTQFKMILRSVRFVDLGFDVAWDFFFGTAFVLTGIAMRRVQGLGLLWGIPLSILGVILIALNAWTYPWPPDTRGLLDIGPFCAAFLLVLSFRLLLLGRHIHADSYGSRHGARQEDPSLLAHAAALFHQLLAELRQLRVFQTVLSSIASCYIEPSTSRPCHLLRSE